MRRFLVYLGIAVGTIVGIALILNLVMAIVIGGRQVAVPDVRGLAADRAAEVLEQAGLRWEIDGERYCVEFPESTVCDQDPVAGHVVKQGRTIMLTISKGAQFVHVPYCIGRPVRGAMIMLEKAGLTVGQVAHVFQLRGYPGEVISTEPQQGTRVLKGSRVNLLVNSGLPVARVILPDMRGELYLPIKMKLERLGLLVRESSLDEEFSPLRSRILMHEPVAGSIVSKGDTINLVISAETGSQGL